MFTNTKDKECKLVLDSLIKVMQKIKMNIEQKSN